MTLNDFLVHSIPEVADRAKKGLDYYNLLKDNKVTPIEYDDLINDLKNIDIIHADMVTGEFYKEMDELVKVLATLGSLLSII